MERERERGRKLLGGMEREKVCVCVCALSWGFQVMWILLSPPRRMPPPTHRLVYGVTRKTATALGAFIFCYTAVHCAGLEIMALLVPLRRVSCYNLPLFHWTRARASPSDRLHFV